MAANNLRAYKLPFTTSMPLTTKDIAYPVLLPVCNRILIEFQTTTGKYAMTGTDGVTLVPACHAVASDTTREINVQGNGLITLYLQSDANLKVAAITCLP